MEFALSLSFPSLTANPLGHNFLGWSAKKSELKTKQDPPDPELIMVLWHHLIYIFTWLYESVILVKVWMYITGIYLILFKTYILVQRNFKDDIFDRSDFYDFYTIKYLWVNNFGAKILIKYFNFWESIIKILMHIHLYWSLEGTDEYAQQPHKFLCVCLVHA